MSAKLPEEQLDSFFVGSIEDSWTLCVPPRRREAWSRIISVYALDIYSKGLWMWTDDGTKTLERDFWAPTKPKEGMCWGVQRWISWNPFPGNKTQQLVLTAQSQDKQKNDMHSLPMLKLNKNLNLFKVLFQGFQVCRCLHLKYVNFINLLRGTSNI